MHIPCREFLRPAISSYVEPYGKDPDVQVGSLLYTLVDPSRGYERAYNRWYERDHFYSGCMVGPWLFAGRRWVATKDLKAMRFPADSPAEHAVADPIIAGSYLATYFIHKGHEAEHFEWANKQVFELYENDRGFPERHHAHTSLYFITDTDHRDPDGVPPHMALDHPYGGLISVHVDRADGINQTDWVAWFRDNALTELFDAQMGAVDQVLHWRPIIPKGEEGNAPMKLGTGPGTRQRSMLLMFLKDHPEGVWTAVEKFAAAVDESGLATVRMVAPFIPTIPGTDRYTDQLWVDE